MTNFLILLVVVVGFSLYKTVPRIRRNGWRWRDPSERDVNLRSRRWRRD